MCIILLLVQKNTVVWNGRIILRGPPVSGNSPEDTCVLILLGIILTYF